MFTSLSCCIYLLDIVYLSVLLSLKACTCLTLFTSLSCCMHLLDIVYLSVLLSLKASTCLTLFTSVLLSLKANAPAALSQRDTDVSCLKACWDTLKGEKNSTFLTVVTSSFPTQQVRNPVLLPCTESGRLSFFYSFYS